MQKPKWAWNYVFKYNEKEKGLIKKIKKFLDRPLSPRWIYYGLFEEPDKKKQNFLSDVLNKARKDKRQILDRDLIVDDTRTPTIWESYDNTADFFDAVKNQYVKNIWNKQPKYIEVWIEDEASAKATIRSPKQILQQYRINVRATKGFNSLGAEWEAYKYLKKIDKPILILYFGDLNPSGWANPIILVRQFGELGLDIDLKRIALNPKQLKKYKIPEYTKISADPRRKEFNEIFEYEKWEAESLQKYDIEYDKKTGKEKSCKWGKKHLNIDLEKIPIEKFEDLMEDAIKKYLDLEKFDEVIKEEEIEREEVIRKLD